jgi:hypothetical protein
MDDFDKLKNGQICFENNLPNPDSAWHKKVLSYQKLSIGGLSI